MVECRVVDFSRRSIEGVGPPGSSEASHCSAAVRAEEHTHTLKDRVEHSATNSTGLLAKTFSNGNLLQEKTRSIRTEKSTSGRNEDIKGLRNQSLFSWPSRFNQLSTNVVRKDAPPGKEGWGDPGHHPATAVPTPGYPGPSLDLDSPADRQELSGTKLRAPATNKLSVVPH
jgi:hypothetical protein